MATPTENVAIPSEFQSAEALRTLANYLRTNIRVKSGVEHEKRVEYFKGRRLVECIIGGQKWPKSLPKVTDESVARQLGELLLQANYFHRSEKVKEKKGYLKFCQRNYFDDKGYFTWMFSGNMMWSNIATGLVIFAVIGFTLLPIWPDVAKKVLWYLSVTFLIATLSFCLIRAVLFLLLWILGYDFWIFPRLFDESLSFQDSFKPIYSFDKGTAGQGYYRLGMFAVIGSFAYWAYSQPTEFDGFIQAQKDFIDDLYTGKLLSDVAFDPKEHMKGQKNVPSLEDLLKELENDEKSITEKATEEDESAPTESSGDSFVHIEADGESNFDFAKDDNEDNDSQNNDEAEQDD